MTAERIKVYSTKYALTSGIRLHENAELSSQDGMISVGQCRYLHGEGKDWHRTLNGAKARAEAMRRQKIESLRKQIAKLEAMTIKVVE